MESVENKGELIGYVVPFDIPSESLKKGEILRHKHGLDDDMFENIEILNSSYCLVPEWVETWDKAYKQVEELTTAPDKFSQVIELIEKQIDNIQVCINQSIENEDLMDKAYYSTSFRDFNKLLDKIKQL